MIVTTRDRSNIVWSWVQLYAADGQQRHQHSKSDRPLTDMTRSLNMQCCNISHFASFPPNHWTIVALHPSVLSPIVPLLVLQKFTSYFFVFEDGVLTHMLRYVKVYTAVMHVPKFQIIVFFLFHFYGIRQGRKHFFHCASVLWKKLVS